MNEIQRLLTDLVNFPSVTPDDAGCQAYMINYLKELGFDCQTFNSPPVHNFFARFGNTTPLLVFAGHTDVVPVGDLAKWHSPPFTLTNKGGKLTGRGAADMKGSLAAMMSMARDFVKNRPLFQGSLGFLITSGEEGNFCHLGTPHVMSALKQAGINLDYCIVGEPSSTASVGDVIKIGRRGSLSAHITVYGKQGHVAYPHLAQNPIHLVSAALAELTSIQWDQGNEHFPSTSLQITHIESGGLATNIIPGELKLSLNFRFSTEQSVENLQQAVEDCFQRHGVNTTLQWELFGHPFLTQRGVLLDSAMNAIQTITGQPPELSTSGGTSDGRYIAPYGVEVIELGPINATIHQVNESVTLHELQQLKEIYMLICDGILRI